VEWNQRTPPVPRRSCPVSLRQLIGKGHGVFCATAGTAELFDWLYDGAHFYVCGDARNMAADVERALVEIVADYGNREEEAAQEYVANLKAEGRYQTDVY